MVCLYALIYLFSLGLRSVSKHAWLLDFLFPGFLLWVSGLGFQVCMCAHASCIRTHDRSVCIPYVCFMLVYTYSWDAYVCLMYAHAYSCP